MNLRRSSAAEVTQILKSGKFDGLLGVQEDSRIEFKRQLDLNLSKDKHKLAKAAAAMANTSGGIVVIGVESKQDPASRTDYAAALRYVETIDTGSYYRVLSDLLHPLIPVKVEPFGEAPAMLVALLIERAETEFPILVTKTISETLNGGSIFGYYKRTEIESAPISAVEIHALIQAGEKLNEFRDLRDVVIQMSREISEIKSKLSTWEK